MQEKNFINCLKAVKYLKTKNIPFPTVTITHSDKVELPKSIRMNLFDCGSNARKMMILRKTNLLGKISLEDSSQLQSTLDYLSKLSPKIVSECNLYPCPKTYALFHVLKNRMGRTVNSLL